MNNSDFSFNLAKIDDKTLLLKLNFFNQNASINNATQAKLTIKQVDEINNNFQQYKILNSEVTFNITFCRTENCLKCL